MEIPATVVIRRVNHDEILSETTRDISVAPYGESVVTVRVE